VEVMADVRDKILPVGGGVGGPSLFYKFLKYFPLVVPIGVACNKAPEIRHSYRLYTSINNLFP
jgi:hypothetical protein